MSKFEQITTFLTVAELGSFAATARKIHVTTAAVSKQVSQLETELGVQLLIRTTRNVSLTELGLHYYEDCKKILNSLNDAERAIASHQEVATGILRIACNRFYAHTYLLPRLPEFCAQNPQLKFQLELEERFPDLTQENIDIIFGVTIEGSGDLVRKRIGATRYVLCASPNYLAKYGMPTTLNDLYQHRYIAHSKRKPFDKLTFSEGKELRLDPCIWLNDTQAMCECAILGMGIVNLHDYEVSTAINNGKLIEILPHNTRPSTSVYLYYQQTRFLLPKIRRFIDFYVGTQS